MTDIGFSTWASLGTIQKIRIGEQIAIQSRVRREHEPPSTIRYSIKAAEQDSAFKMTHIEAKSINLWLRYDPKWNVCGNKMFRVISQPNIDGSYFNMGHFKG